MADDTLADYIARDRERLHKEREMIFDQQQELENRLAEIDRELSAIDAYEAAKSGKPVRQAPTRAGARPQRASRGSKREELLAIIRGGDGLTRGDILEKMGLKGNRAGEMSVSNALTALTKANQVVRKEGKYVAA